MSNTDTKSSINSLIGTFATVNTGNVDAIPDNLVCIDTANNRIGVNTIDPAYGIHVLGSGDNGRIFSTGLTVENEEPPTKIFFKNLPISDTDLSAGQLYKEGGFLKIK